MRLRPGGATGVLVPALDHVLAYYENVGRTWERQALIKARPIAGDMALGEAFIKGITPFVYRKYLTFDEINEIKGLKRQIQRRTARASRSLTRVDS